ncbi:MAG: response regulator [Bacillota bacterium]
MKILIAEDDLASRKFLFKLLSKYGKCDLTIDGIEAMEAFAIAHDLGQPYDLLCLDIMMPKIDGLKVFKTIREYEEKQGLDDTKKCKVIITSALSESEVAFDSPGTGNEVYETKPIDSSRIKEALKKLKLI